MARKRKSKHANPTYMNYRILGDEPTEFPQPLPTELIVCNSGAGATGNEVIAALREWRTS